ncbi:MAG: hypothetical protein ABIJ82_00275 [Patescibacteria group bacterium]
MFTFEWYHLALVGIVLVVVALLGCTYALNKRAVSETSIIGSPQEYPAPVEEAAEDEDDEEDGGTIHIIFKNGKSLAIRCDSLDEYNFTGGSLSLEWDGCGIVVITNGDSAVKEESYDTDEEALILLYTDVSRATMLNL